MNTIYKIILSMGAVLAAAALPAAAAGDEYMRLVAGLRAAAADSGVTRVSVDAFSAAAAPAAEEAAVASEKVLSGLAADKRLEVLDQSALEAQAGGKPGWLRALPSKLRPQAIIKGTVYGEGKGFTVAARLVDAASGRVLAALETSRKARVSELPPVPDMDWGAPVSLAAVADPFRDAPADGEFDCSGAFKDMDRLNARAVDLKARYWAAKMNEPGFSVGALTRNPGSEIRDPQTKQKFYELLSSYHERGGAALDAGQARKLEQFMSREGKVIDRCGIK